MKSSVYFVVLGPHIKIGYSVNLRDRMGQYRSQFGKINILGHVPGGRAREAQVHQQFSQYRDKGEWFHDVPELRSAIAHFIEIEPPIVVPLESYGPPHDFAVREKLQKRDADKRDAAINSLPSVSMPGNEELDGLPIHLRELITDAVMSAAMYRMRAVIEMAGENTIGQYPEIDKRAARACTLIANVLDCHRERCRREAAGEAA